MNIMTRVLFFCLFLCGIAGALRGQHFELGLMAGGANYIGDLSENSRRLILRETRPAAGLFGRYNFNENFALRLGINYAGLSAKDANAFDQATRERNLSFKTHLFEAALTGELNLPGYQPYNHTRPFSPYLFAGVGLFRFNPQAELVGANIPLQPLGTEGQGLPDRPAQYSLTQVSVPFGAGIKYALTEAWTLGFEVGARLTFTDYLDDVSSTYVSFPELLATKGPLSAALSNRTGELTGEPAIVPTGTPRGDDSSRDWYFITALTVSYNFIDNGLIGSRRRSRRSKEGCY